MRALVLGATGQDGSYLIEQLIADGHEVTGVTRRPRATSPAPLVVADLLDQASLERALLAAQPDVVFNLAAVTAPGAGWGAAQPPLLAEVTGLGVERLVEAMLRRAPNAKLVHASSSAVFDIARYGPYGAAKRYAHDVIIGNRDRLWCSNAVLFSHTSPHQDPRFLAPRIFRAAASDEPLTLGDVDSRRDWGYAPDYCRALQVIAEHDQPGGWVVSTNDMHSVRELATAAADVADRGWWRSVFGIDQNAVRVPHEKSAADLPHVSALGWKPEHTFNEMVQICVRAAMARPNER